MKSVMHGLLAVWLVHEGCGTPIDPQGSERGVPSQRVEGRRERDDRWSSKGRGLGPEELARALHEADFVGLAAYEIDYSIASRGALREVLEFRRPFDETVVKDRLARCELVLVAHLALAAKRESFSPFDVVAHERLERFDVAGVTLVQVPARRPHRFSYRIDGPEPCVMVQRRWHVEPVEPRR